MSHDLRLNAAQSIFLKGLDTKFRAFVSGFGGGKTFVGCLDLLLFASEHPGLVQGYFGPTYPNIRDVFYPTFTEAAELLGFRVVIREANKEVHIYRGRAFYGTVICRSMDRADSIIGFKIARALVDEIDTLKMDKAKSAWNKIIARLRLIVPGVVNGIGLTTTPEGFRFVYDTFKREPKRDYSMVQASTYENAWALPEDYIPSLLDTYPEELISAYLMGQFVNLTSGTVYRNYDRVRCRSTEVIKDNEPLHIGQDFNVSNMASVINVDRPNGIGDDKERPGWHVVGELTGIMDTPALIGTLKDKFEGHAIYIYPDASGGSRKTINASTSDLALLRDAGFKVRARDANPPVKDRILAMNTAYSKSRLWVNDKAAPRFAEAQEQQSYDKNGEPDKTTGHDHLNDGAGYFVHWTMPVAKPTFETRELRL